MSYKYNKLLINGLIILKELEFANIPAENEIEHTFSNKYEKDKEKLLKKLSRSYWKYVNTIAKKIAIIIITFIIAFSSLMTVDAFRNTLKDFVYKVYDTLTKIELTKHTKEIKTYYTISNIPNYYVKTSSFYSEYTAITLWSTSQLDIVFTQMTANRTQVINSENGEIVEFTVNNIPCLIFIDKNSYCCYWEFDDYRFELIYPVELGEEFMSEVVGHLVEVDPEDLATE